MHAPRSTLGPWVFALAVAAVLVGALVACGDDGELSPADTVATNAALTRTSAGRSAVTTPTLPPSSRDSPLGGAVLGGSRADWEMAKGKPTQGVVGDLFGRNIEVAFLSNRAWHVELLLSSPIAIDQARAQSVPLLPADATKVRTYVAAGGQTVEVFHSDALAEAFPPGAFIGGSPGTFIRIAARGGSTTSRVVLGLGDNP